MKLKNDVTACCTNRLSNAWTEACKNFVTEAIMIENCCKHVLYAFLNLHVIFSVCYLSFNVKMTLPNVNITCTVKFYTIFFSMFPNTAC